VGIGNVANLMNPQRFVLGGGVTKAGARFWEVVPCLRDGPAGSELDIVPAALGMKLLWGAVALANDGFDRR